MPYPALPTARRIHYEIDGSIVGWNGSGVGFSGGMVNIASAAQMLALNEETPTVDSTLFVVSGGTLNSCVYVLFSELKDLSFFMHRMTGGSSGTYTAIQGSTNTTTGVDGTWNTIGTGAGTAQATGSGDWWRSTAPQALTSNNTGLIGVRFGVGQNLSNYNFKNVYLWGAKSSGQTPNDILFLQADGVTEWTSDDDWGDVQSTAGFVTHTYYVKNASASLTANSVTVKSNGSDTGQWTVSLDNITFGSTVSVGSLAPGATQIIYVKYTPVALAGGVLRPYAAFIEADVVSWS